MAASAPVKSAHPLHNFSLSLLKWGQSNAASTTHHRRQRTPYSGDHSEPESDKNDSEQEHERDCSSARPIRVGSRSARHQRFSFSSCTVIQKPRNQPAVLEAQIVEKAEKPSAVSERAQKEAPVLEKNEVEVEVEEEQEVEEEEEVVQKPWNLRPRKASVRNGDMQDTVISLGSVQQQTRENNMQQPKSMRLRGLAESNGVERKAKRKFWIALSKEEIEEDIFIMTGSRPVRRPRKRPKIIQKQLDNVFPGLWLVGTTVDSYRVTEPPVKR